MENWGLAVCDLLSKKHSQPIPPRFGVFGPSASNFNFFSRSLEQFFLTVGQNNFCNKIPLFYEQKGFLFPGNNLVDLCLWRVCKYLVSVRLWNFFIGGSKLVKKSHVLIFKVNFSCQKSSESFWNDFHLKNM